MYTGSHITPERGERPLFFFAVLYALCAALSARMRNHEPERGSAARKSVSDLWT